MTRTEKIIGIVLSAILAIVALFGWFFPIEVPLPPAEKIMAQLSGGVTNLTSLALSTDLDVAGTSELDGGLTVDDTAFIVADATGNTTILGALDASGATTLNSTLDVDGNISSGTGAITVTDSVNITGAVDCDSTLNADGAVTFNSTLDVDGNISSGTGAITVTDSLNVTGTVDFDSTLNVDGASTLVGDVTASALVDVGTWLNLTAATTISVTAGAIITPAGTYQPLTSGSAVTCSTSSCIADGTRTGDLLVLINNNASDVITIDGTGANVELKTDVALGAGDTITLIWAGSDWYGLSNRDNS